MSHQRIFPILIAFALSSAGAMAQNTPSATVQALYDAVRTQEWARVVNLADPAAVDQWYRMEHAALANLVLANLSLPQDDFELQPEDTAAVEDVLKQYADTPIRVPPFGSIGNLASLSPADLLRRNLELMVETFGFPMGSDKIPPFRIEKEIQQEDGGAYVQYQGYIGFGGGLPDGLELRRRGGDWRYVIASELTSPDLALLIGFRGGLRP